MLKLSPKETNNKQTNKQKSPLKAYIIWEVNINNICNSFVGDQVC